MEMMSYDLVVVGGGPAGSCAAICAARAGMRVLLLERGQFPRHKVCGEFVSSESLALLGTLLSTKHAMILQEAIRVERARIFLDGRIVHTDVSPPAASIARADLDLALWESAKSLGVGAFPQTTVQRIEGTGPFQVVTTAGSFHTRSVIDASGRWSNLSTQNWGAHEKWIGLKAHFAELSPSESVDLYFFDGGYCGVEPVSMRGEEASRGRINVAAMVRADVASSLPDVLACHSDLLQRSRAWEPLTHPVSTSPLIFREPSPVLGNKLLVGDAAGFIDPFVGDGISLALRSGALAVECLIPLHCGEADLATAADQYRRSYEERLKPIFRASSRLRTLLRTPKVIRRPILMALENNSTMKGYLLRKTR
jgi:flavin-dependent dehydrogenase